MTMDIGHMRGFLFSVVKTSVLTAYLHHALASGLSLWYIVPILQTTKKGIIFIKKKKRTLKNLNLWMDEEYLQRQ